MSAGLPGRMVELIKRDVKIFFLHRKHRFHIALGTSFSIGHLSLLGRTQSYFFSTNDDAATTLNRYLSYPFVTKIIQPDCIRPDQWRTKRIFHRSYHPLAYLHPNHFQPDVNILKKYNIQKKEYVIIRSNIHRAHHDSRFDGIPEAVLSDVHSALRDYQIISSRENDRTPQIDPWDMHHVMAFAKMVIADSSTMVAEAAVLGVPALCYHPCVGYLGYLKELEHKFGLVFGFGPGQEEALLMKIKDLLAQPGLSDEWQLRRGKMLSQKEDLTQWLIDWFEKLAAEHEIRNGDLAGHVPGF